MSKLGYKGIDRSSVQSASCNTGFGVCCFDTDSVCNMSVGLFHTPTRSVVGKCPYW